MFLLAGIGTGGLSRCQVGGRKLNGGEGEGGCSRG